MAPISGLTSWVLPRGEALFLPLLRFRFGVTHVNYTGDHSGLPAYCMQRSILVNSLPVL